MNKQFIEIILNEKLIDYTIKGKTLIYNAGQETCRVHLNLFAEMCIEYCWKNGYEIEISKSRVDALWTSYIHWFERFENSTEWECVESNVDTYEDVDYCECIFKTTNAVILLHKQSLKD